MGSKRERLALGDGGAVAKAEGKGRGWAVQKEGRSNTSAALRCRFACL